MPTENEEQPVDLSLIDAEELPQDEPDGRSKAEEQQLELARKEVELEGLRQDQTERKDYAAKIFWLISLWLVGVFAILLLQGFLSVWGIFLISDAVLLAAIGGTTVNVIGIFVVVVNYLFPKR